MHLKSNLYIITVKTNTITNYFVFYSPITITITLDHICYTLYQIIKQSWFGSNAENLPDVPEPSLGHGWEYNAEGDLTDETTPIAVFSLVLLFESV